MNATNEHASWTRSVRVDSLPPGEMTPVELGGTPLVLLRDGDDVRAFEGKCPHAGAPLEGGRFIDGKIVCPWHAGAFDAKNGACLAPPPLRDLRRYDARIVDGNVEVALEQPLTPPAQTIAGATKLGTIAIAGSGAAASVAAKTLREAGFDGRLLMIGPHEEEPIDRTMLTKQVLSGKAPLDRLPLFDGASWEKLRVERLHASVTRLDAKTRTMSLDDGRSFVYDAALVATGAEPRRPEFAGSALRNVFTIRHRTDVERLRESLGEGSPNVAILGSSFIALEAASALSEAGARVTIAAREQLPLGRMFGERVASALLELHRSKGVVFHLATEVSALVGRDRVEEVVLESGERFATDAVVAGYGVVPNTAFVTGLEKTRDGGIVVDETLRAAPGLYVAGDVAVFPQIDGEKARIEHWRLAEQHGRQAARNLLGANEAFRDVPFFWTQQHGKRLAYVGHSAHWNELIIDGDPDKMDFIAWYLRDGTVQAALSCGRVRSVATLVERMRTPLDLATARAAAAE